MDSWGCSTRCPSCGRDYACKQIGPSCSACGEGLLKHLGTKFHFMVNIAGKRICSLLWACVCSKCSLKVIATPRYQLTCQSCNFIYDWYPMKSDLQDDVASYENLTSEHIKLLNPAQFSRDSITERTLHGTVHRIRT